MKRTLVDTISRCTLPPMGQEDGGRTHGANRDGRRSRQGVCNSAKFFLFCGLTVLAAVFPCGLQAVVPAPGGVDTDALNLQPLVQEAYQHLYMLDYDAAIARFEKVQAAHPSNPLAVDFVLNAVMFREFYRLDLLDTTFYAHDGFLNGKHAVTPDPATAERVNQLYSSAVSLSEEELRHHPEDVDALFARGWARSLRALYVGLVERSFVAALHVALQARGDNEKVLKLDPRYVDAKLVVGVDQYVTGSLPFGIKLVVGAAGITGSKSRGLDYLRDAAARGVMTSVEARTALAFFLRREAHYGEAVAVGKTLVHDYPRNFLFRLELANLTKDAGQGAAAVEQYRQLLAEAKKPGYFPSAHLELAWFGLADTLEGQKDFAAAADAYNQASAQPTTSPDLRSRCDLGSGRMYDLLQQRDLALRQYQAVLRHDADSAQADAARKYMKSPFSTR